VKLDRKLVSAFAAGIVLACGIVYFSVKPAVIVPQPVRPPAPTPKARPSTRIAEAPPVLAVKVPKPAHVPIREKPSPMPPPVRHEQPAIAPYEPPSVAASKPIENVPAQNVSLPAQPPAAPKAETRVAPTVTVTSGTVLAVRLGQMLSSARDRPGDSFYATLTQPLVVDGWVIAERGARVEGRIVDMGQSVQGAAHLGISMIRVALSDGQILRLHTDSYTVASGLQAAEIPVQSRLTFRVLEPITITERLN
jgi:hypothetical protein